ncbi:aldo/keto reductase [Aquamicrobium sp. LC103]|uniref:aldo/keto reductase n=1 Tax=Aquamicrobium sp. LC103 TaxID=1120658 RepID=UPI00063EA9D2|nr:aldo/keto reductase [Aquamicrobium sp. LC103]TKT74495.1 aldo/keto reductase [Aquamicrobium sp. LC103]
MRRIRIGQTDIHASAIGLGCMGMSEFYGDRDDENSMRTLERAFEIGVTMYDTADMYGRGHNETLVGKFATGRRDKLVIASKFGVVRDPNGPSGSLYDRDLDNSPDYIRKCCDASLKRLGTDHIDLYYIHRMDHSARLEDTIGTLGELVKAGKIRAIGLSEISADVLRRADAIHPISALQSEYSLWHRDVEDEILPACREIGATFVAYSPLGRGFLTGAVTNTSTLASNDLRLNADRFRGENLDKNLVLLERIKSLAAEKGATLGQIAIAWLLGQGDDILPIPGTKRIRYLEENVGAEAIRLSRNELDELASILSPEAIAGSRVWKAAEEQ